MSTTGNIIVDGTGGEYVGPQGCNFFPIRIYEDCVTINDPFSLDVGGGRVLKTKMNTASLAYIAGRFQESQIAQKVFFDTSESWGADLKDSFRRQKVSQMTRLFQHEVAVRQRVNAN